MVEALYIAATQDKEEVVAAYLQAQLSSNTLTLRRLQQCFDLIPDSSTMTLIETTHITLPRMTHCSNLPSPNPCLNDHLKRLKLSQMKSQWQQIEQPATQEHWSYAQFLLALCEGESQR